MSSVVTQGSGDISNNEVAQLNGPSEWKNEQEKLLNIISEYESKLSQASHRLSALENDLKVRTQERDLMKSKILELEDRLVDAQKCQQQNTTESQAVEVMKEKSEELLTRAKGVIFEKTKVCKNQELQIEALTQQVSSLKEVVAITKDLLDIRNVEVKHLQERLDAMESKIGADKERQDLMHSKLEKMIQMNTDLKREYETQLCLFTALRERYNERELARNVLDNLRQPSADDATEETSTITDSSSNQQ